MQSVPSKPRLASLPLELRLMIAELLPPSSQLSLRLVARDLFNFPSELLSRPSVGYAKEAPPCEKRALRRILQQVRDVRRWGEKRCIVCGQPHKLERFTTSTPICPAHDGRFLYGDGGQEDSATATWISVMREFCVHRGAVVEASWLDDRQIKTVACDCGCDSCGHWAVECLVKV